MKSYDVSFLGAKADYVRIGKGQFSLATQTTSFKPLKNNCEDPNKISCIP